jgi:hypothetical protein
MTTDTQYCRGVMRPLGLNSVARNDCFVVSASLIAAQSFLRMILSENRSPLFGIMRRVNPAAIR